MFAAEDASNWGSAALGHRVKDFDYTWLLAGASTMRCHRATRRRARKKFPIGTRWRYAVRVLAAALLCIPLVARAQPAPARLRPDAVTAFDRYVRLTEARNESEMKQPDGWLWPELLPQKEREAIFAALKKGEIRMKRLETLENGQRIECPGAMMPHWIGIAFIAGAKLDDVLTILKDYNHHSGYYAPDVERSNIELQDGERFRVFLRFRRRKVITVVLNTEHEVQYFRDEKMRAHSRSSALRIAQVENPGKAGEREKTPGNDDGFLWRMETWWRLEERDGGVYIESEAATLTRDIPAGLGWLVEPFVNSIPRESLSFTLEATRKAVEKQKGLSH